MDNSDDKRNVPYNDIHRFFDVSPDLLAISANGFFVRLNPAWEQTLGYSIDELLSQPSVSFVHPDDRSSSESVREKLLQGVGVITNFENRLRHKDGSYRWLEWTVRRYPGEEASYSVARDITPRKEAQEALRQSQQAMRALLDSMSSSAIMVQTDGTVLAANQKAAEIYGKPVDEVVGKNIYDLVDDEEINREREVYVAQLLESGQPLHYETIRNGRHLDTITIPIRDNEGQLVSVVTTAHDITHLKQTELALRRSEHHFRSVLESAAEGILLTTESGEITLINQEIERQFGYTRDELIGQPVESLLPEAQRELHIQHRTGYAAAPDVRPMGIGRDLSGRRKDGTIFPVEVSLSYVPNDGELQLMALVVDITERKRTETALRRSEHQFRSALELAAEAVFVVNEAGEIVMLNQQAEIQFGYPRDELLGQSIDILMSEGLRDLHAHHRQNYHANPALRKMGVGREVLGRRKDGSLFPIEASLSFVRTDDQLLVMAFVADITERKQMENERIENEKLQVEITKERQLIELRQQFMSMISHEFRTPLTVIATTCEILDRYFDQMSDERRKERIVELNGHVQTMISLLNDILMLSKIQVGAAEFSPEPLSLPIICQKILETASLIDNKQHTWKFEAENVPETIHADQRLLEYILTNLLSNAIKYSPPGTEIRFAVTAQGNQVTFQVQDHGRGVPVEDQARLFEAFHRAKNVGEVQGTGLGLAIVRHNVERHGGTINFRSTEGQGTTFWVEMPLSPPPAP